MKNKKFGLYIHIPFCAKKCNYCDFLSAPSEKSEIDDYVAALCEEIEARGLLKEKDAGILADSIFFGGGTPSLLDEKQFKSIIKAIKRAFSIEERAEITIECNPESITKEKLGVYKSSGVNRISFGLQSANKEELLTLGRIHTWEKFHKSFMLARTCGFTNINVDLMSALPGQTEESFEKTLQKVIACDPEHISAYSLIIEDKTPFYEMRDSLLLPTEEEERHMYWRTKQILKEAGYERYEISNYAKKGFECIHNLGYWSGAEYLGLGLGASSYVSKTRFRNTKNRTIYQNKAKTPELLIREVQELTKKEQMEEYMFLGLRKTEGVRKSEFQNCFGVSMESIYGKVIDRLASQRVLKVFEDRVFLTEYGVDVSNVVLAEFLLDESL